MQQLVILNMPTKIIRKLKAKQIALQFPNFGSIEECMIVCYSGASLANLRNTSSQGEYIVFLYKDGKNVAPVS